MTKFTAFGLWVVNSKLFHMTNLSYYWRIWAITDEI
jgi:hypothetical protein